MLAKVHFLLPFKITCPINVQYTSPHEEIEGYQVWVEAPQRSDQPATAEDPEHLKMDGAAAFQADVIVVVFRKETFRRVADHIPDPSLSVMIEAINRFLRRLRFVSSAPHIREISEANFANWTVEYRNDDGSEIAPKEGLYRQRHSRKFGLQVLRCDPKTWEMVFSLDGAFKAPPWRELLLDATGAFPHIGSAIVLAATALETFIAEILNAYIKLTPIPDPLWSWINERKSFLQRPTIEEKFDTLLKIVVGHSLKENEDLWIAFQHLKTARNKFVHEGLAQIGGVPVDEQTARNLISKAEGITSVIREWLPKEMQWPVFLHPPLNFEFAKTIIKPAQGGANQS